MWYFKTSMKIIVMCNSLIRCAVTVILSPNVIFQDLNENHCHVQFLHQICYCKLAISCLKCCSFFHLRGFIRSPSDVSAFQNVLQCTQPWLANKQAFSIEGKQDRENKWFLQLIFNSFFESWEDPTTFYSKIGESSSLRNLFLALWYGSPFLESLARTQMCALQ